MYTPTCPDTPSPPITHTTHTHARAHTYVILNAFQRQYYFRERASLLRYTYIACLVSLLVTNTATVATPCLHNLHSVSTTEQALSAVHLVDLTAASSGSCCDHCCWLRNSGHMMMSSIRNAHTRNGFHCVLDAKLRWCWRQILFTCIRGHLSVTLILSPRENTANQLQGFHYLMAHQCLSVEDCPPSQAGTTCFYMERRCNFTQTSDVIQSTITALTTRNEPLVFW
jgi:hypothetical protein